MRLLFIIVQFTFSCLFPLMYYKGIEFDMDVLFCAVMWSLFYV